MKKTILGLAVLVCAGVYSDAQVTASVYKYTYTDEDGIELPVYGPLRRVSPNGQWAAGGDEYDETGSFVINTSDPEKIIMNGDGLILDIDNDGMCVGAWYERQDYTVSKRAAVLKDGQWKLLPQPQEIIGQSYAVAISSDSRIIGGHAMCASSDAEETGIVGGKYFPVFWRYDDATGEYVVDCLLNNVELPGTLGFFSYDMTPDGNYLCGLQCLDMGDVVAAVCNRLTGSVEIWHVITRRDVPIEYMGQTLFYSDVMFVDGVMDGGDSGAFRGMLTYASGRFIFGCRDVVSDVDPDGNGVITTYATMYDTLTGEFVDGRKNATYICGVDAERNFTSDGLINLVTPEDGPFNLTIDEYLEYFCGVENAGIAGVYSIDDTSKVWGGAAVDVSPLGEMIETPVLVILDEPVFTGIADIVADGSGDVRIVRDGHTVSVLNAGSVAIYTVAGTLVTTASTALLQPGVYVVVADGVARKIKI